MSFSDPKADRQTAAGSLDPGFLTDSGTALDNGDSPYMN